jgi:hypothetical protein
MASTKHAIKGKRDKIMPHTNTNIYLSPDIIHQNYRYDRENSQ